MRRTVQNYHCSLAKLFPYVLLLFSEQHETTATVNYCVVFKVYSGLRVYSRWADSGRDVEVGAIAKDPDRRRPVM